MPIARNRMRLRLATRGEVTIIPLVSRKTRYRQEFIATSEAMAGPYLRDTVGSHYRAPTSKGSVRDTVPERAANLAIFASPRTSGEYRWYAACRDSKRQTGPECVSKGKRSVERWPTAGTARELGSFKLVRRSPAAMVTGFATIRCCCATIVMSPFLQNRNVPLK